MDLDRPYVSSPELATFAPLAAKYCALVESHATLSREYFLECVHTLLPRLYAAALALPSTDVLFDQEPTAEESAAPLAPDEIRDPDSGTHEEWRQLYDSLTVHLGLACYYREIFDPYDPVTEVEVTGSLADDFADIYRDLRCGLRKWDRGETGAALWEWRFNLEHHWGEHLTGALKAMWAWTAWHDGTWPAPKQTAA